MKRSLLIGAVLLVLPCFAGADTVRPAVGKPLQQAELLIQRGNYTAALQQVNKASAVGSLTPFEAVLIAQLRGAAEAGAGHYSAAASAYQIVLASGAEPPARQTELIQATAGFYYQAQDYPHAAIWVSRYVAADGQDPRTRALLAQAYYAEGNYAQAEQAALREQQTARSGGQQLPESELQLLASAAQKSGDNTGYFTALTDLLRDYPKPQYWSAAIALVTAAPGFPDSLTQDVYQLRFVTGTLNQPADYEDYVERAILAGDNSEANAVITKGFASGVLNDATDAGHASRLKALAAKNDAAPQPTPADFIQQAKSGGSQLDLGFAYFSAGDTANAIRTFNGIHGAGPDALSNPEAALALLWEICAENTSIKKAN
jgi:tetratricopeptide (TPR) repeat protein